MAAEPAIIVSSGVIGTTNIGDFVYEVRELNIELDDTADATDTIAIPMASNGINTVLGVFGCKHTTNNSVVVTENPTSAVSGGTLTLTIPAGTDDDLRFLKVMFI